MKTTSFLDTARQTMPTNSVAALQGLTIAGGLASYSRIISRIDKIEKEFEILKEQITNSEQLYPNLQKIIESNFDRLKNRILHSSDNMYQEILALDGRLTDLEKGTFDKRLKDLSHTMEELRVAKDTHAVEINRINDFMANIRPEFLRNAEYFKIHSPESSKDE